MRFRFDPNLDYQLNAIQAVVRLFEGAPAARTAPRGFELLHQSGAIPNTLDLSNAQLLAHLQATQQDPALHNRSPLPVSPNLAIREDVLKTLRITREHFAWLYDNVPYHEGEPELAVCAEDDLGCGSIPTLC